MTGTNKPRRRTKTAACARKVLEKPQLAGWRTSDEDEVALRRWRGLAEIVAIEAEIVEAAAEVAETPEEIEAVVEAAIEVAIEEEIVEEAAAEVAAEIAAVEEAMEEAVEEAIEEVVAEHEHEPELGLSDDVFPAGGTDDEPEAELETQA